MNAVNLAKAKAFTLWVKNTIGSEPSIFTTDEPGLPPIQIKYTPEQREALIKWLDGQVFSALQPGKPPADLELNFGDVLTPWALRYIVPSAGAVFAAGYLTKGFRNLKTLFRGRR